MSENKKNYNLSQQKRVEMLEFLKELKNKNNDDESLRMINEIEIALTEKKYGLVWEEHIEEVEEMLKDNIPVFEEIKERKIKANDDNDYNFLIEGDNLHSLKLLEKTHKGKIDVIYIDPPYNTGEKDFTYNDKYIEKDDNFKHSKWLSFINKRLKLAKQLLSETGAIFIQINDVELAQLKLLCDEIFGENNFLNLISINMKNIAGASGGGEDKKFKKNCEYILIYAKEYTLLPIFKPYYTYTKMSKLVKLYDIIKKSWKYSSVLVNKGKKEYIASTIDGDGNEINIFKRIGFESASVKKYAEMMGIKEDEVYNFHSDKIYRTTMPQSSIRPRVIEKMEDLGLYEDVISIEYIPKTGKNKGKLYEQFYSGEKYNLFAWLSDVTEIIDNVAYKKDLQGTYWDFTAGTKNLTKEGKIKFSNGKKPIDLIKTIIKLYYKSDIKILDFFAGSGTTGHAVAQLNKEDGGKRKYILCTNNENNICESITYKRLQNIQNELPHNLKYLKTNFISKFSNNEDSTIKKQMLNYIKSLIELEYMTEVDNENNIIVFDENQLKDVIENSKDKITIFITSDIFLSKEEISIIDKKQIKIIEIPEYYFSKELREVGEL